MRHHVRLVLLTLLYAVLHSRAKILRNNALMTKMVSHFQKHDSFNNHPSDGDRDNERKGKRDRDEKLDLPAQEPPAETSHESQKPEKVLSLMQNVLCRNFPTIPCSVIMQDADLSKLIRRSIQQISNKKFGLATSTPKSRRKAQTLSPLINSEDLSSFLEVANTGYFDERAENKKQKSKKKGRSAQKMKNHWSHEKPSKKKIKGSKDSKKGTEMFGNRKKMRKFYPHKIKYKDKANKRGEYRETDEKVSMSIELPEMNGGGPPAPQNTDMSFNMESPVWRIDYMKHGIPSLNTFGFGDEKFRGKLVKSRPEMIPEDNAIEQATPRKDVLHPDVFIKKNFVRQNMNMNADDLE